MFRATGTTARLGCLPGKIYAGEGICRGRAGRETGSATVAGTDHPGSVLLTERYSITVPEARREIPASFGAEERTHGLLPAAAEQFPGRATGPAAATLAWR